MIKRDAIAMSPHSVTLAIVKQKINPISPTIPFIATGGLVNVVHGAVNPRFIHACALVSPSRAALPYGVVMMQHVCTVQGTS